MTHTLRTRVSTELNILILSPFLKKNSCFVSIFLTALSNMFTRWGGVGCLFVLLVAVSWVRYRF